MVANTGATLGPAACYGGGCGRWLPGKGSAGDDGMGMSHKPVHQRRTMAMTDEACHGCILLWCL